MTQNLDKLRKASDDAHTKVHALQAEKDEAMQKVRTKYTDRLRTAIDKAAAAQKELCDAEAAGALADRPDGPAVAKALVEQGGLSAEAVAAVGIDLPE
jgi:hypothetical protein